VVAFHIGNTDKDFTSRTSEHDLHGELRCSGLFWDFLTLELGTIGCPETSGRNYHYTLRDIPQQRSSQILRGEA